MGKGGGVKGEGDRGMGIRGKGGDRGKGKERGIGKVERERRGEMKELRVFGKNGGRRKKTGGKKN